MASSVPMKININGELFDPHEARIEVLDHGFLFGDSIYEVVRTVHSKLYTPGEHFARLEASAERIALELPLDADGFVRELERTRKAAGLEEAYLRLIVTRGVGEIDLHPETCKSPSYIIIAKPLPPWTLDPPAEGMRIAFVEVRRNARESLDPAIKSGNYLNNVIALTQARERGAAEGIMLNPHGHVAEGTTSNIFWVRDGYLETPALDTGILPGITRRLVVNLARQAGITVEEGRFRADDVRSADEVFLTSTLRNVMPVSHIDGEPVGEPFPGPITQQLSAAYQELLHTR